MGKRITWNTEGSRGTGVSTTAALNGMSNLYASMQGNNKISAALSAMGQRRNDNENQNAVAAIMGASPENRANVRDNVIAGMSKGANPISVMADSNNLLQQRFKTENQGRELNAEIMSKTAFAKQALNQLQKSANLAKAEELLPNFLDPKTGKIQSKAFEKAGREFKIPGASLNAAAKEHRDISGITAAGTAQLLKEKRDFLNQQERTRAGFKGSSSTDFLSGSQASNWRIFTSDLDALEENKVLYYKYPKIPAMTRQAIILDNFSSERVLDRAAADSALNVENERLGAIREAEKAGTK